jgi:hypothetical protein
MRFCFMQNVAEVNSLQADLGEGLCRLNAGQGREIDFYKLLSEHHSKKLKKGHASQGEK